MSRLEELLEQQRAINKEIGDLRKAELLPSLEKYVGKCYRYKNSFRHDEVPWYGYFMITGIKNSTLVSFQFEAQPNGNFKVGTERFHFEPSVGDEEISSMSFFTEWAYFMDKLTRLV